MEAFYDIYRLVTEINPWTNIFRYFAITTYWVGIL